MQVNNKMSEQMTDESKVSLLKETEEQQEETNPIMVMIQQATAMSGVDTGKMQVLMDMYYKDQDHRASKEFMGDFSAMQGKLPRVVAGRKNTQSNSKYAAIEDINKIVQPFLTEYGFGVLFKTKEQSKDSVTVEATITHKSGHTESTTLSAPIDDVGIAGKVNKTKVHGTGSAVTYAKRYALCALLNISIGEQDTDGNLPSDMITEEQGEVLQSLITDTDTDVARFCRHFKIESLIHMPASKYLAALGMLSVKKKKEGEKDATA